MDISLPTAGRQRGTAMVEFAIALPILLFMLFATAEFGLMISDYNTLTKSVQDGARYAASTASGGGGSTGIVDITPAIQSAVQNLVVSGSTGGGTALLPGLTASDVTVTDAGNGYVSVTATYAYQPMMGATLPTFGFGPPIGLTLTFNAASVMPALP